MAQPSVPIPNPRAFVSISTSDFLALVHTISPEFDEAHLSAPVRDTPMDSLDLLMFRSSLEARLGRHLSDEDWLNAGTLQALFDGLT